MNAASRLLLVLSACLTAHAGAATLHAFATSTTGSGDLHSWAEVAGTGLSGLAAADAICQTRAAAGGLDAPEEFVAWLSDRDDDAYCRVFGLHGKRADHCGLPADPVGAGPWLRSDGVPFAATIETALADNVVYSTLNVDESGAPSICSRSMRRSPSRSAGASMNAPTARVASTRKRPAPSPSAPI